MKKIFMTLLSICFLTGISFGQDNEAKSPNLEDFFETYYYENSIIELAEGVDLEKYESINPSSNFTIKDNSVKVYAILRQDEPLKTKTLIVFISDENEDLYDSFELDIDESWNFTSFTIDFDSKGHYYIDIYNSDNTFINSTEVDIY